MEERYKHLNKFLKEKLGERTLKICIDGGFTCPNRDGKIGTGGCVFCSNKGSGEHICSRENISNQVKRYFLSARSNRANKFIAYFQNFTNTYDTVENLKRKYDAALIDDRIVAIAIATRPDCINEDVAELLRSYMDRYYVWVELGLQTSNDRTAKIINRGYESRIYTESVNILNKYGIDVVTHIMVGLPGETKDDLENTVKFLNNHNYQGLKVHSTYVIEDTVLAKWYNEGKYKTISLEYYLECLTYVITHISPDIVIHRISGDAPEDLLIAPDWNAHKKWVLNGLDKILRKQDLWQGKYYITK